MYIFYIIFVLLVTAKSFSLTCNLFVSPDGSSTECSYDNPCSIQTALDTAKTNGRDDVICLKGGVYNITTTLIYDNDTVYPEDNRLTLLGEVNSSGEPVSILRGSFTGDILKIDLCSIRDEECQINRFSQVLIKNIKIQNATGQGLKIYTSSSDVTLENVVIENSSASSKKGVLYIFSENGDINLEKCKLIDNSSQTGAFYIESKNAVVGIKNCIFQNNISSTTGGSGYIFSGNDEVYIVNSIISLNTSSGNCGGILIETVNGDISLTNNDIVGNQAISSRYGGLCIYADNDTPVINVYNNIFWENTATGNGEDIYINDDNDGNLRAVNLNIRNNFASCDLDLGYNQPCFLVERGSSLITFNNITGSSPGIVSYPSDLHLSPSSVCIDAGNNSAPHLPDKDLDGNRRIHNFIVDLGVYEYGSTPSSYRVEVVKIGDGYVYSFPSGIDCGDICSYEFPATHLSFTLTARGNPGYMFDRWEGDCSVCGRGLSCSLILDKNYNCRARFIKISGSGGGGCTFFASASVSKYVDQLVIYSLISAIFLIRIGRRKFK